MGLDPEIQELTIAAAASLAMWTLDEGYAVGLLASSLMMGLSGESASTGDEQAISSLTAAQAFIHRVRVPMARGSGQLPSDDRRPPAPAILDELTRAYVSERYGGKLTLQRQRAHLQAWVPHLVARLTGRASPRRPRS